MKIAEFTQSDDINEQIKKVQVERDDKPNVDDLKKQWRVSEHRVISDSEFLKDKEIKDANGDLIGIKKVNRIAGPFQKLIVKSAVTFGFGNDVEIIKSFKEGSDEEKVYNAVLKILDDNKISVHNRKVAKECYRAAEVAELWYYEKTEKHSDYGFECEYRIRVKLLTPWTGEKLYPHFDAYDKMQAFARAYTVKTPDTSQDLEFVEIFTADEYKRYKKLDGKWQEDTKNIDGIEQPIALDFSKTIAKIPVIYAYQEEAEWEDVQYDIDRLELLFSRHAEINDYHAAPKTFVEGEVTSAPQAGEANGIIQGSAGSKAYVLSWDQSPESIKLEINTRLSNIFKFTKTPDVSFESIKALNQISGVMLKMLFMDAHMKVMEKEEIWDDFYERRFNLLKTYIGKLLEPRLADAANSLSLKPKFKPYMIDDLKGWVDVLMTANGNKPIISQEKATELSGLTNDPKTEWKIIQSETEAANQTNVFQPTNL